MIEIRGPLRYSSLFESYYRASKRPSVIYANAGTMKNLLGFLLGLMEGKPYYGPLKFESAEFMLDWRMADGVVEMGDVRFVIE